MNINNNEIAGGYCRSPLGLHESEITSILERNDDRLQQLVGQVFSHQVAAYGNPDRPPCSIGDIAKYFYRDCYLDPDLRNGIEGAPLDAKEFLRSTALAESSGERNYLSFLLGEVGVGKTAFVNYLISEHLEELVDNGSIWFLRVDLEAIGRSHGDMTIPRRGVIVHEMVKKTLNVFHANPSLIGDSTNSIEPLLSTLHEEFKKVPEEFAGREDNGIDLLEPLIAFCHSVEKMTNRRLFLVIDNIDYICRVNDRATFTIAGDPAEQSQLLKVRELVGSFLHSAKFGRLGSNVLFVTRRDSYRVLKQLTPVSHNDLFSSIPSAHYEIRRMHWRDALEARKELLHYAISCESEKGRSERFDKIIRSIDGHLGWRDNIQLPLAGHIAALADGGLRKMMEFFTQYAWLPHDSGVGGQDVGEPPMYRFVHHCPVGLLTYILGAKRLYSQTHSEFPNIFLVNPKDYDRRREGGMFRHSYWLKYLIVELLMNGSITHFENILNCFCGDGDGWYDESLIRYYLGVLAYNKTSNMIRAERELNNDKRSLRVRTIRLTERGRHCKAKVFGRFFYLQLIVDDPWLPLPLSLKGLYDYDRAYEYSYVVAEPGKYGEKARMMIGRKAMQVLVFIDVLGEGLAIEEEYYSRAFSALRKRGVEMPNPAAMRADILKELEALNRVHAATIDMDILQSRALEWNSGVAMDLREMYKNGC